MTRRALLVAAVACLARADSADEAWDVIGAMASALSEANAAEFLQAFDPAMPGYQHLSEAAAALVQDYEIEAAVDLVSNDGDGRARTIVSDWQFRFGRRAGANASLGSIRRQQRITCKLEKQGKKWRIVALDPLAAFDPPRA